MKKQSSSFLSIHLILEPIMVSSAGCAYSLPEVYSKFFLRSLRNNIVSSSIAERETWGIAELVWMASVCSPEKSVLKEMV